MSYTIQAIIGKSGTIKKSHASETKIVPLNQDMEMLPLTDQFLEDNKIPLLPLTDEGLKDLPNELKSLCERISKNIKLVYIEAEFFGGKGTQACATFHNGQIELGPIVEESAINKALNYLGVKKEEKLDEFDSLGLDEHRDTNKWV